MATRRETSGATHQTGLLSRFRTVAGAHPPLFRTSLPDPRPMPRSVFFRGLLPLPWVPNSGRILLTRLEQVAAAQAGARRRSQIPLRERRSRVVVGRPGPADASCARGRGGSEVKDGRRPSRQRCGAPLSSERRSGKQRDRLPGKGSGRNQARRCPLCLGLGTHGCGRSRIRSCCAGVHGVQVDG
jgi:hypothetical protein